MMYATRTRQAKPEPFAEDVGLSEKLRLAHRARPLAFAPSRLLAFSVLTPGPATLRDGTGDPPSPATRHTTPALSALPAIPHHRRSARSPLLSVPRGTRLRTGPTAPPPPRRRAPASCAHARCRPRPAGRVA